MVGEAAERGHARRLSARGQRPAPHRSYPQHPAGIELGEARVDRAAPPPPSCASALSSPASRPCSRQAWGSRRTTARRGPPMNRPSRAKSRRAAVAGDVDESARTGTRPRAGWMGGGWRSACWPKQLPPSIAAHRRPRQPGSRTRSGATCCSTSKLTDAAPGEYHFALDRRGIQPGHDAPPVPVHVGVGAAHTEPQPSPHPWRAPRGPIDDACRRVARQPAE